MARFYFDFHDSKETFHQDEEGLEFTDADQARADAARALGNYVMDNITFDDQVVKVVIRGRDGPISQVRITVAADKFA